MLKYNHLLGTYASSPTKACHKTATGEKMMHTHLVNVYIYIYMYIYIFEINKCIMRSWHLRKQATCD